MAQVAAHLSIAELEERFRTAKDPILARHAQVIWLLAQGHTSAQVSAVTSFGPRWIAQLLARYMRAASLSRRRQNGAGRTPEPASRSRSHAPLRYGARVHAGGAALEVVGD